VVRASVPIQWLGVQLGFVRRFAGHRGVVLESRATSNTGRNINAKLALGFNHRTYRRLYGWREIPGAGTEGLFDDRNVETWL
jgi:hypothetical protein